VQRQNAPGNDRDVKTQSLRSDSRSLRALIVNAFVNMLMSQAGAGMSAAVMPATPFFERLCPAMTNRDRFRD
jgi:hypothetical protein